MTWGRAGPAPRARTRSSRRRPKARARTAATSGGARRPGSSHGRAVRRRDLHPDRGRQACANLYLSDERGHVRRPPAGPAGATMAQNPKVRSWPRRVPSGAPPTAVATFRHQHVTSRHRRRECPTGDQLRLRPPEDHRPRLRRRDADPSSSLLRLLRSAYGPGGIQAVLDQLRPRHPFPGQGRRAHGLAGFEKNAAGSGPRTARSSTWTSLPGLHAAIGPVITQQLITRVSTPRARSTDAWDATVFPGDQPAWVWSTAAASTTLRGLPGVSPEVGDPNGTPCTCGRAAAAGRTRRSTSLLDKMEAVPADNAQDSEYMDGACELTELYLENMPEIVVTEEYHTMTNNEHYWTGYATKRTRTWLPTTAAGPAPPVPLQPPTNRRRVAPSSSKPRVDSVKSPGLSFAPQ